MAYIGHQLQTGEFKKLDSIESSFNDSSTTFNLYFNSTAVSVGDATNLIVSLNGVIQEPTEAYTLATGGSQIVFSTAPTSGSDCFITQLGSVGGTATPSDGSVTTSKFATGTIESIVDSDYVQLRQNDIYRDSAFVTDIIDSDYVTARVSSVDSAQVLQITQSNGIIQMSANISADYTVDSGNNAFSAGPITIDSGYSVTVPSGSVWTIV